MLNTFLEVKSGVVFWKEFVQSKRMSKSGECRSEVKWKDEEVDCGSQPTNELKCGLSFRQTSR